MCLSSIAGYYNRIYEIDGWDISKTDLEASKENRETAGTDLKTNLKTDLKTQDKIIAAIIKKPSITAKELAKAVGIGEGGVKYHLAILRKKGILIREGPIKGGKWIIKDDADRDKWWR